MLSGKLAVLQAPMFDGDTFDAGALGEDCFVPAEVGVRWRHVAQAFMVALVIIVLNEGLDLGFEVTRQEVVFEQDAVFEGLVPALDLALCLGMIGRAAHMLHAPVTQPFGQIAGDVAGAVVTEQPWFVLDMGWSQPEAVSASSRVSVTSSAFIVLHRLSSARLRLQAMM